MVWGQLLVDGLYAMRDITDEELGPYCSS